ncbi:LacI family transcriptional regulator [Mucilaginibacter sp. PAMC 26640]|nr:LacI family transcriptional regulator [Mucilaginibacter sp. PAMC 26640]
MFKAATIKDIALALSVSPSTVSRALRDSHEIGAKTKKTILDYATKINYHSNPIALSLRNKQSYSIGVMVADVANSFFAQTINGIESVAYKNGYNIIISQSHDSYERELVNIEHLANRSVDGLLISMSAQTTDYSHIADLHHKGLPIVFFDRIVDTIDTYKVTTDNFKASYDATNLLLSKGYGRIAHLANAPHLSITIERLNGYKKALQEHGVELNEDLVSYCHAGGRDKQEVEAEIKKLLNYQPDAMFIASDRLSTASLRAFKKLPAHLNLPIIGFSNSDVIDLLHPQISIVRQRAFEMGEIAAEMLIKIITSKFPIEDFETRLLDAELQW